MPSASDSAQGGAKSFKFEFELDGQKSDPDTIVLQIMLPDRTLLADVDRDAMEKVSTGVYRYTLSPLSQSGAYRWRIKGTWGGVIQATTDTTFRVAASVFD